MMKMRATLTFLAGLTCVFAASIEGTRAAAQDVEAAELVAEVDALAPTWMAGHWIGEGFGGTVEEWWSPARGGAMMGVFRLIVDDETQFLELITMSKKDDLWSMRLRHFHPDLSSWEKDNQSLVWPETVLDQNRAGFGPVLYELNADGTLQVSVEVGNAGATETEKITLRRM